MSDGKSNMKDERVDELLRVNAELAGEMRRIVAGTPERPRSASVPSARRLGNLQAERDALKRELKDTKTALENTKAVLSATKADRDGLECQNREMDTEIARLRRGAAGFVRRARAALLDRLTGGRGG